MGILESHSAREEIDPDAQEPSLHPLLRSRMPQQVGFPVRAVQSHGVLFCHRSTRLHLDQVDLHRLCTERTRRSGDRTGHHRGSGSYRRQHSPTFHGQEDQHLQHLHLRRQLPQRNLPVDLLRCLQPARDGLGYPWRGFRPLQRHLRCGSSRLGSNRLDLCRCV